jgi:hypothetical protein
MPPPAVSPDQIRDYAPIKRARIVEVDANVAAYFGDLFRELRKGLQQAALDAKASKNPLGLSRKAPSNTGAAHNHS